MGSWVKSRSLDFKSSTIPKMRMIDFRGREYEGRRERKGLSARCTTSIYPVPYVLNTYWVVLRFSIPCSTETTRACRRLWNFAAADRTHDDRTIYRPLLISSDTFSVLSFHIVDRASRFSHFLFFAFFHFSLQDIRLVCRQMYGVSWIHIALISFLKNVSDTNFDQIETTMSDSNR